MDDSMLPDIMNMSITDTLKEFEDMGVGVDLVSAARRGGPVLIRALYLYIMEEARNA